MYFCVSAWRVGWHGHNEWGVSCTSHKLCPSSRHEIVTYTKILHPRDIISVSHYAADISCQCVIHDKKCVFHVMCFLSHHGTIPHLITTQRVRRCDPTGGDHSKNTSASNTAYLSVTSLITWSDRCGGDTDLSCFDCYWYRWFKGSSLVECL